MQMNAQADGPLVIRNAGAVPATSRDALSKWCDTTLAVKAGDQHRPSAAKHGASSVCGQARNGPRTQKTRPSWGWSPAPIRECSQVGKAPGFHPGIAGSSPATRSKHLLLHPIARRVWAFFCPAVMLRPTPNERSAMTDLEEAIQDLELEAVENEQINDLDDE